DLPRPDVAALAFGESAPHAVRLAHAVLAALRKHRARGTYGLGLSDLAAARQAVLGSVGKMQVRVYVRRGARPARHPIRVRTRHVSQAHAATTTTGATAVVSVWRAWRSARRSAISSTPHGAANSPRWCAPVASASATVSNSRSDSSSL